jgi:hypothetical protein
MGKRKPVTARTIAAVASEIAGHPLDDERAAAYAMAYEPILRAMEALRAMSLKNVEPAVLFRPVTGGNSDD